MKINLKKALVYSLVVMFLVSPLVVDAQSGSGFQWGNLVPCGETDPTECGPEEFFELIFNVVTAVIILGITFSTIIFAYAGFLYITAQGNQEQVKKATKIFGRVGIGLFFALIAYLVIQLIVNTLGLDTGVIPIQF